MAIGEALGGLGGAGAGIYNMLKGFHGGQAEEQRAIDLLMKLQDPHFDPREIPYQDLQLVAQYFPQAYEAIVPQELKQAVDSPEARASQVRSLGTLEHIRDEGMPLAERVAAQEAQAGLQGELQRGADYGAREMAQRGRAGGGEEWAARMGAGQQGTALAAQMSRDLIKQQASNRMAGAEGAFNAGGALRGADINFSANAADAVNRFNEMRTGRQNEAAQFNAQAQNQGALQRTETKQGLANVNTNQARENAWQNLQRKDVNEAALRDFQLQKGQVQSNALLYQAAQKDAREAARRAERVKAFQSAGKGVGGLIDYKLGK